jgi:hypothetical protein
VLRRVTVLQPSDILWHLLCDFVTVRLERHAGPQGRVVMQPSKLFVWIASVIAIAALVPIVAATLAIASVIWIPLLLALVITLVALMVRSHRRQASAAPR